MNLRGRKKCGENNLSAKPVTDYDVKKRSLSRPMQSSRQLPSPIPERPLASIENLISESSAKDTSKTSITFDKQHLKPTIKGKRVLNKNAKENKSVKDAIKTVTLNKTKKSPTFLSSIKEDGLKNLPNKISNNDNTSHSNICEHDENNISSGHVKNSANKILKSTKRKLEKNDLCDSIIKKPAFSIQESAILDEINKSNCKNKTKPSIVKATKRKQNNAKLLKNKNKIKCLEIKPCYVPEDYFGFNNLSDVECSPPVCSLTKFDPSKPFRTALYVHQTKVPRINPLLLEKIHYLNPSLNLTNMSMANTSVNNTAATFKPSDTVLSAKSPAREVFKVPMTSTPMENKKMKFVQRKITDVLLPVKKKTDEKVSNKPLSILENSGSGERKSSAKESELQSKKTEELVFQDDLTACKFSKPIRRRSYVKKPRLPVDAQVPEPFIEETFKSTSKPKKKKKVNKLEENDEEFEKWSQSINSEFDEIDKFEVSFST